MSELRYYVDETVPRCYCLEIRGHYDKVPFSKNSYGSPVLAKRRLKIAAAESYLQRAKSRGGWIADGMN
jgi:hypothetical protein